MLFPDWFRYKCMRTGTDYLVLHSLDPQKHALDPPPPQYLALKPPCYARKLVVAAFSQGILFVLGEFCAILPGCCTVPQLYEKPTTPLTVPWPLLPQSLRAMSSWPKCGFARISSLCPGEIISRTPGGGGL